jgi:hypothetical protein
MKMIHHLTQLTVKMAIQTEHIAPKLNIITQRLEQGQRVCV